MRSKTILVSIVTTLCAIGLVMVYSSSYIYALDTYGNGFYFFQRHLIYLTIGFIVMFFLSRVNPEIWEKWSVLVLVLATSGLVLVLIPGLGSSSGGALRWIALGSVTFQPGEFMKGGVVIYMAYVFGMGDEIRYRRFLLILPMFFLLFLQPDFGTAMIIALLFLFLFFLSGKNLKALFISVFFIGMSAALLIMNSPYRKQRILTFMNPWSDPENAGFQIIQSFLAFTSGGISGVGVGNGKEKLFYLPAVHNDFIFSVIGEEFGFIGVAIVVLLFLALVYTGFRICSQQKGFRAYLGAGLTILVSLQALINIGVVLGMLPTKGLTLPFISYGGSSLIANMAWVGILMSIASSSEPRGRKTT